MPLPEDQFLTRQPGGPWSNHHGTVTVPVAARWQIVNENQTTPSIAGMKATAERLQRLIGHAVAQRVRLRAIGSRWSFSEVAAAENGWALQTQRLNYHFAVGAGSLDPGFAGAKEDLYLVQAGRSIAEINRAIEAQARLRSLRTSGASNGQTIAGAIGTGTHGSAIDVGALESQVAGSSCSPRRATCGSSIPTIPRSAPPSRRGWAPSWCATPGSSPRRW